MRIEQEQIDAVEADAVDSRGRRQVEHRVEIDRRLRVGPLADEPRPHRVVQCGFRVCSHKNILCVSAPLRQEIGLSGFPGPKCFRMTSGSVSLRFSIRTPARGNVGGDEKLVLRHLAEADHRGRRDVVPANRPVPLSQDEAVCGGVLDRHRSARHHRQLFRGVPCRAVTHPLLAIAVRAVVSRTHRPRKLAVRVRELRVHVGIPVEHADEIVEVVMIFGPDVLGQKAAIHDAAVDQRLEHRKDVAVHLRLVRDERSWRVKNSGIDLPAGTWLEPVRAREKQDAVVSLAPVFEAAPHVGLRRTGLEAHERERKRIFNLVVLRRKVIRFGLALLSDQSREGVVLMEMMGNRPHVVEELAEQVPSAFALHRRVAEQQIAGFVDERLQEDAPAVCRPDVTQALVIGSAGAVRCMRRRREPTLVDAAPVTRRAHTSRPDEAAAGAREP